MRKTQILFSFIITTFLFLTSCEIKEEITFDENGGGEIYYGYDMSALLKEAPINKNSDKKKMDTIFDFNKILNDPKFKDSIAKAKPEEKEILEALKNMKMKMQMDAEAKKMEFGFSFVFKNINDVKDIFGKIKKAQELTKISKQTESVKDKPVFGGLSGENQNIDYAFDGRNFTRKVILKKELTTPEKEKLQKSLSKDDDPFSEIFSHLNYTIVLNFPKKIKKINVKNAVFSNGKKTVTITYKMEDFLMNPKNLDLKVKLAKK